jgi:HEAT repeat protein
MIRSRALSLLKIHPDEARIAALVGLFFGLIDLGRAVGDSAADALFLRRFGVEYLPYMYIGLGVLTFGASLGYAAFDGRMEKRRFFPRLLLTMALLLMAERAAIMLNLQALYPLLWLTINVTATLLGILTWTTASEVCDTRQAKRLFPLFVTASILGGLLGSVLIGPVAHLLGTENLIVVYVILLAAAALLIRSIAHRGFKTAGGPQTSSTFLADIQAGFNYVKRTPLLQLLGVSAVLFSILYFSVTFPYNKAVAAAYPDEASLAGFLGLFKGISSALMFVVALLIANRLYARIGIVFALLILPMTYLLGFLLFAINFSFTSALIVRLAQLTVLSGVGDGSYGAFFNVVPPDRRSQVRAFDAGVPAQIGIILSGILMLIGDRLLTNTTVFAMGMLVAGLCAFVVWRMRPLYGEALVAALRAGRIEVFTSGERIFSGLASDLEARRVLTTALDDPKAQNQQLAAEMLARSGMAAAAPALIDRLPRVDSIVRAVFIRTLGQLGVKDAVAPVAAFLADPIPAVRAASLEALPLLVEWDSPETVALVRPLLKDSDFAVRIQAAVSLAGCGDGKGAAGALLEFLNNAREEASRVNIVKALGQVFRAVSPTADQVAGSAVEAVIRCLVDESPFVRRAACSALTTVSAPAALKGLTECLSDSAPEVRAAAAQVLQSAGPAATSIVLTLLPAAPDPGIVLAALPAGDPAIITPLRGYARVELRQLREWHEAGRTIPRTSRASVFLASLMEARADQCEQRLIKVIGLLGNEHVMKLIARTLKTSDKETHATAIEALDTLGDKQLVKDFIPLLEDFSDSNGHKYVQTEQTLIVIRRLITDGDPWLRAVAMRAAGELELTSLIPDVQRWLTSADEMTREAARETLHQLGGKVDTLTTLSLVERTLLLREIPLFKDLSPDDLVQVARTAEERWFDEGAVICRQGEIGDELFVVAAGQVRITKQSNGQERELAIRQTGEFIGEMAIIDSAPRVATVTAVGEVRTLVITGVEFQAILRERSEVSMAVMRALSHRLRELS